MTTIYSILVEPQTPDNFESTAKLAFGLAFHSTKSSGPWGELQRKAVRQCVTRYMSKLDSVPQSEKQQLSAKAMENDVFEFFIDSDATPYANTIAFDLYAMLKETCEKNAMVVHMLITV